MKGIRGSVRMSTKYHSESEEKKTIVSENTDNDKINLREVIWLWNDKDASLFMGSRASRIR